MATWLIVVIVVAAVVLIGLALIAMKRSRSHRALRRERIGEQAGGHRTESQRHTKVADEQRARADELAQRAAEADARAEREREMARHHGRRADDLEDKL